MSEGLARTTIVNYRSRLKLLKEVVGKLTESEQEKAKAEIALLELKLGPHAQAERRPGRPKTRTEIPDEVRPKDVRIADQPWSEEAKTLRLKAKQAKLLANLSEVSGELSQRVEVQTEADKAWAGIEKVINEETSKKGIEGTEQGDGRTSQEGQRRTGEERR